MTGEQAKESARKLMGNKSLFLFVLLFFVTGLITIILHPQLSVRKDIYREGDVARRDIKALKDFFIEFIVQ